MPLSEASPRSPMHTRTIRLDGFQRDDGLYDIEAELTDTKSYAFDTHERAVPPGTPLHNMQARLTVNDDLEIFAAEAVTNFGPFSICGGGAPSFGNLVGLTIRPGFLKAANQRLAGTISCTHLRELLQQMATVAFQTTYPVRSRKLAAQPETPPRLLNTCYAYDTNGPVVAHRWPQFYTGMTEGSMK